MTTAKKMIHRIILLENKSKTQIEKEDWNEMFYTFAEIKPASENKFQSLEGISFGHVITEELFLFNIRFDKRLHAKMRIKFQDRIFEIKRIINFMEKNIILQIIALEIR
jgi:SPP1 family predicted phage head-tail adaptor